MWHQVLEVSVPLKALHNFALVIGVDLLRIHEVRPEVLSLKLFGVLGQKVECRNLFLLLIRVSFDHLANKNINLSTA